MATSKKKSKPVSGSERVKKAMNKKIKAGLVSARIWVHPDEADAVRAYANKKPLTKAINSSL